MLFCDRYGPVGNLLIHLISTDSHCPGRNFATSSPGRFSLGALEKAPWGRGWQFCKSSVCGKTLGYGMVCTSNVHGADSLLFFTYSFGQVRLKIGAVIVSIIRLNLSRILIE